jgi:cell cycle sensor histidine kinase DivJ
MHPLAQEKPPEAGGAAVVRERVFLAPRLLGGLGMLAVVVTAFMPRGVPSVFEIALLAWLVAGFLIAYFLSRAGEDESAHVLSTLALTGLVTTAAFSTGGLNSFAAIWLVLVPVEAALSGSRRVVALASMVALGAAGFLLLTSTLDPVAPKLAPADGPPMLAMLGIVSALLYAMGLALGSQAPARGGDRPDHAEEGGRRLLARDMADLVTRHDRNGHVLFASSAAERVLGAELHDLHGRGLFERVHVADRPAYLTALRDAATLCESRMVEIRVRRDSPEPEAAGGFVWIEMLCWPVERTAQAQPGEGCEVVAVMRDVTARKDEEHAVEDARAQVERANVAKSRFLATMSHELRTPLNAIIGFSEMLREEGALMIDARQRHDYAQLINESGHHLLSVVNGILDMSKIESGNFEIVPEPVATGRVIAECCELLALRARQAGIEVTVDVKDDLPEIVADKRALLQIMLNLVSNAVKFTNRGGKVTVVATAASGHDAGRDPVDECGDEPAHGRGEVGHEAAHIVIKVEDTGVGIGAEDLPRVGEPFFQARSSYDRRHDGTGLGVSIVKGLLSLHGGWMEIESRVGEGTRVVVHLPLDCEGARHQDRALARVAPRVKDTPSDLRADLSSDIAVKRRA